MFKNVCLYAYPHLPTNNTILGIIINFRILTSTNVLYALIAKNNIKGRQIRIFKNLFSFHLMQAFFSTIVKKKDYPACFIFLSGRLWGPEANRYSHDETHDSVSENRSMYNFGSSVRGLWKRKSVIGHGGELIYYSLDSMHIDISAFESTFYCCNYIS